MVELKNAIQEYINSFKACSYCGSMLNDKAGRMNSDNVWLCKDVSTCSRNDFSSAKENVCSKIVKRLQETLN